MYTRWRRDSFSIRQHLHFRSLAGHHPLQCCKRLLHSRLQLASVTSTEWINRICFAHSVAPTDASNPPAITTPDGYTDAPRESRYLAFG